MEVIMRKPEAQAAIDIIAEIEIVDVIQIRMVAIAVPEEKEAEAVIVLTDIIVLAHPTIIMMIVLATVNNKKFSQFFAIYLK
jgi:hypothetical protein